MAGLKPYFREERYNFTSFGSHRKDDIKEAWQLLHSFAEKVEVFWLGSSDLLLSSPDPSGLLI
jgi:hypothetical protein